MPDDLPHSAGMSAALRKTKRDIDFSLSNTSPFEDAADWAKLANALGNAPLAGTLEQELELYQMDSPVREGRS